MPKFIFNPVHSEELQLYPKVDEYDARYVNIDGDTMTGALKGFFTVSDKATILALSASPAGQLAYATNTKQFFLTDGTTWQVIPITLAYTTPVGQDIGDGMGRFEENYGYSIGHISKKTIHNSIFGYYNETNNVEGAFRYDLTNLRLEVYNNGVWRTVIMWTFDELNDRVQWSDFTTYDKDTWGNDLIHGHRLDIGFYPSQHLITGGTF